MGALGAIQTASRTVSWPIPKSIRVPTRYRWEKHLDGKGNKLTLLTVLFCRPGPCQYQTGRHELFETSLGWLRANSTFPSGTTLRGCSDGLWISVQRKTSNLGRCYFQSMHWGKNMKTEPAETEIGRWRQKWRVTGERWSKVEKETRYLCDNIRYHDGYLAGKEQAPSVIKYG